MIDETMLRAAALKVLSDFTKAEYDKARADAAKVMDRGDRKQVYSPLDGTKIGAVYMTDPQPDSILTNEDALTEWMSQHYPGDVESGYQITGSQAEILSVLIVHAPNLLKKTRRVKRSALMRLHADALAVGQPIGPGGEADMPGIEVRRGEADVRCRPNPDTALSAVMDLVHNHKILIDGTVPELEASE